jgi:hypothetical protein
MRKTLDSEVLALHSRPRGKVNKKYPLIITGATHCQALMKGKHFFPFLDSLTLLSPNINDATFCNQTYPRK